MKDIKVENGFVEGTIKLVTEFLLRTYVLSNFKNVDESKYSYMCHSSLNDIRLVCDIDSKNYKFWAGVSGCNWNIIDSTGGNHMVSNFPNRIVRVELEQLNQVWHVDELRLTQHFDTVLL